MNNNSMPPQFKFAATIVIWIIVAVILLTMLTSGADFNWIFGMIMLGIAGGVTSSIMGADGGKHSVANAKAEESIAKAKLDLAVEYAHVVLAASRARGDVEVPCRPEHPRTVDTLG